MTENLIPNYGVIVSPFGNRYEIMIDDEIGPPSMYREEFIALQDATENDFVDIYINSPGGYLNTTVQFMNAIRNCQAHVTTHLTGEAYSGGSMMFLQGDTFIVNPMTSMMLHSSSGGYAGKSSDLIGHAIHTQEWMNQLMGEVYKNFLTPDEIQLLLEGKEFWMLDHEIVRRLEVRNTILEQEAKGSVEVSEEEIDEVIQHVEETTKSHAQMRMEEFYDDIKGMSFKEARCDCQLMTGKNPKSWQDLFELVEEYYGV